MAKQNGKTKLTFETTSGILNCWKNDSGEFTVDLGPPRFKWNEIPLAEEDTSGYMLPDLGGINLAGFED